MPDPTQTATAAAPKGDKPVVAPAEKALITVEAVEIEGNKIFIAGTAEAGSTVKVYANTDLLGDDKDIAEWPVFGTDRSGAGCWRLYYSCRYARQGWCDGRRQGCGSVQARSRRACLGRRTGKSSCRTPRLMVRRRPLAPSHRRRRSSRRSGASAAEECRWIGYYPSW